MDELIEKDLHCIARLVQAAVFYDNHRLIDYCYYCKYKPECDQQVMKDRKLHLATVRKKLQKITGVYLDTGTHDLEKKLMLNSSFSTKECGN